MKKIRRLLAILCCLFLVLTMFSTIVQAASIPVTSITVTGMGNATTVGNGGTLQMNAEVLPEDATDKTVTWSVTPGTGSATIDSNGLLTATGIGTVVVTAAANDGSGITGTLQITVRDVKSVLTNCDTSDGWISNNTLSTDSQFQIEGSGCVQAVGSGPVDFLYYWSTPVNTNVTEQRGVLNFWLYCSDVTKLNYSAAGWIEITNTGYLNGGVPDWNPWLEYLWKFPKGLKNGWNFISLPMKLAGKRGSPDISTLNLIRIHQFKTGSITMKVDNIHFTDSELIPVTDIAVTATGNPATIKGGLLHMNAEVLPADATDKTVTWSILPGTGNATIDSRGLFTATEPGTVTVVATANDGSGVTGTMEIEITSPLSAPNPRIIATDYPNDDIVIADYVVTDAPYNADNTGNIDSTLAIQHAINDCYSYGGGTVWLPAGTYKIGAPVTIKPMVTLRGDWRDPDTAGSSYGTVIIANVPSSTSLTPGLFRMGGSSGVIGLTVYYPNQSASNPILYPYTFEVPGRALDGEENYMLSTIKNVTLLNAYNGICTGITPSNHGGNAAGGQIIETYNIINVKGTVLNNGLNMRNSAEVGVIEKVKFYNSYWADAPEEYDAPEIASLNDWTRANAIAYKLGDIEWGEIYGLECSDYKTGIQTVVGDRTRNGFEMFGLKMLNCNKALEVLPWSLLEYPTSGILYRGYGGLNIHNSVFQANQGENPIPVDIQWPSIFKFTYCSFEGTGSNAIKNPASISFQYPDGSAYNFPATITATDSAFVNWTLDNYKTEGEITTNSCYFNQALPSVPLNGVTDHVWKSSLPKPPNNNFYNVQEAPYNAVADGSTDCTTAIQAALDDAYAAGGGTVYLPAGKYKVGTHLTIPANVELRGAAPVRNRDEEGLSIGTVLYAYEGKATTAPETDTAFITLIGANAGVNGLRIFYPENNPQVDVYSYPYTIRGNGSGVYVINTTFINSAYGMDFKTNRCDNHYIRGTIGTYFYRGIVVGASTEGWIEDNHSNPTVCVRVGFNIPGWLKESDIWAKVITPLGLLPYAGTSSVLQYITVDGTSNEHLLQNFVYGGTEDKAHYFTNGAKAVVINDASDGNGRGITIDPGCDVKIINWFCHVPLDFNNMQVPGSISGMVKDSSNNPIAGATVSLTVSEDVYSVQTASDGTYTILNVPVGRGYTLTASKSGYDNGTVAGIDVITGNETSNVGFTLAAPSLDMIFAIDGISLSGSAMIAGNTGTNSMEAGSVGFAWSTGIEGNLFIGPGADWTQVIDSPKPDPQSHVTGDIANLETVRSYPLPEFPSIPELEDKGDFIAGWWPEGPHVINESGSYSSITVDSQLTINIGDEDVRIVTRDLSVRGSGNIVVSRTGSGRLILYVTEMLDVAGSGSINKDGDYDSVIIYYSGRNRLKFDGSTKVAASIFAKDANVEISDSGGITGHIVTGGSSVDVIGNAEAYVRVIYAPNAKLTISASGKLKGVALARRIELSGEARITYDDSISLDFFEKLDWAK